MKKFYFLLAAFIAIQFNAQQAGKAGELLKNEVSKSEINTQKNDSFNRNNPNNNNDSFRGNSNIGKQPQISERRNPNYQWNYNYNFGYAEVFIRIPEMGMFSVEIGDQRMSNSSGKFRFFDLKPGNNVISIYDKNFLVYRTRINVRNNTRMVLDYFNYNGLYLLGTYNLRDNYGDVWNDTWNNPYNNSNNNDGYWDPSDNFGNGNSYNDLMNDREFSSFLQMLKRQSFDDDKLNFLAPQLNSTSFNSNQIKLIMKEFSFDKNRLEFAKRAYKNCVDKRNYYLLNDAFDFDSYARQLNDYIRNR